MNDKLKQLYKDVILKHNNDPFHYDKKEDASLVLEAYNPLCGDKFKVFLDIEGGKIQSIHFHGYGCAISKASTSVMVQALEGHSVEEARELCKDFLFALHHESEGHPAREDFEAFAAAREFPGRLKCASLSWDEMSSFLKDR
jgi:nitrogen fixation NifU-like protein